MIGDKILTQPFFDQIRLRGLWPPGNPVCKLMLALLPRSVISQDTEWLDRIAEDDWYLDGGGPCLVLGEAKIGGSGQYYPQPSYDLEEALRLTRLYRKPQRDQEETARRRDQRVRGQEQQAVEHNEHWRRAVAAQEEEQRRIAEESRSNSHAGHNRRIAELEKEVADLRKLVEELQIRETREKVEA